MTRSLTAALKKTKEKKKLKEEHFALLFSQICRVAIAPVSTALSSL